MSSAQEIISPNKNIKVVLVTKAASDTARYGQPYFSVRYKSGAKYIEVLPNSPLGIIRSDQAFSDNLRLIRASKPAAIRERYTMVSGKRAVCSNDGTERVLRYENSNHQELDLIMRVYDNGIAFSYRFPAHSDSVVTITKETTAFVVPEGVTRWMQPYTVAYEDFFPMSQTGRGNQKEQEWGLPALLKFPDRMLYALISEANVSERHCATRLCNLADANVYQVMYPPARKTFNQTGVVTTLPWTSQWHTIQLGTLGDIVASTLITDVSAPSMLKHTEWIQPGSVSWIYWANNHGSKDYRTVVDYVDLAVEMHWPYVLIDWEWDVMTNGGTITDAVKYARSKGIKVMMWYNSGVSWLDPTPVDRMLTHEKRVREFAWLDSIGVSGIKVDFFAGDQQDMMKFYLDILKDAAESRLMVNFHGATVPRGWARTWPNLMTMEAVYGAEWYNNRPDLTHKAAAHNTTLPFTRNVIGSMDYTPVTFSNSQHPHITSYGHELALSVVFESGLQHFADRPSAYRALPGEAKEFLKTVPVSWDDTKLLDGYPGEKVVIARRKGSQWYIGGLNGKDEAQTLDVDLAFLGKGRFSIQLMKDGADSTSFAFETKQIKAGEKMRIDCLPRGGFVAVLKKHDK